MIVNMMMRPRPMAALVVAGLPKTRSGKILRGTIRKIALPMPATIDEPAVLSEIEEALKKAGYGATPTPEIGKLTSRR